MEVNNRTMRSRHYRLPGVLLASLLVLGAAGGHAQEVAPLNQVTVPDVNMLGLLDGTGSGAWPEVQVTEPERKVALQALGKALFWDMQVGGDGLTACATCHYHAGADHRSNNQLSPGFKGGDFALDLLEVNQGLTSPHYNGANDIGTVVGFPVNESHLLGRNWGVDAPDGTPGSKGLKGERGLDINDVASSQGVRAGTFTGLSGGRVDYALLAGSDAGFDAIFTALGIGIPATARRVEPRNAPTVINAVFNLRNFWDGRADTFFNGVSPLGFRDPGARVKTYVGGQIAEEKLLIPFSSLASQAVGPPLSDFEMQFAGRGFAHIGRKIANAVPLADQKVACDDSLLGELSNCEGSGRGLTDDTTYAGLIRDIFDERFWGDGNGADVCLDVTPALSKVACTEPRTDDFTLLEYNFALFFGLAVQAYEATLFTETTIVDLLAGGVATGIVTSGNGRQAVTVNVTGMPLETCTDRLAPNNNAQAVNDAEQTCAAHYAKFIHPGAVTGAESGNALFPVASSTPIGGCANPSSCASSPNEANAISALLSIERGVGRFFAGATACGICHFNPEFTGATVSALTGFGAAPVPPLPPGQLRKEALEVPMERMIAFNGQAQVYDAGFYNIGVRPTVEDLSLGDAINGVPLSFAKLREAILLLQSGQDLPINLNKTAIGNIADVIASGELLIPTSPTDLTPKVFDLALACGPGLVGNGNAQGRRNGDPNNNPNTNQCIPDVIPGEKILMNGAFKAPGLRNVKFTGPYFHNGAKKNLRQVMETYKTAGHFPTINFNNLDAGMRIFDLGPADEASVIEMMETGLTDWRVAHDSGKFDHPELCVPHGHDPATGQTLLKSIPAVGENGHNDRLQTFEEQLDGTPGAHSLVEPCSMPGIADLAGKSLIDVPLQPVAVE